MEVAVNTAIKFELVTCCDCGTAFYVPGNWIELRRRDHKLFTCPNGHQQHFTTSKEELQKLIDRLQKIGNDEIALVENLGPLVALTKIMYDPEKVSPQELEKLLAILLNFQKSQEAPKEN